MLYYTHFKMFKKEKKNLKTYDQSTVNWNVNRKRAALLWSVTVRSLSQL